MFFHINFDAQGSSEALERSIVCNVSSRIDLDRSRGCIAATTHTRRRNRHYAVIAIRIYTQKRNPRYKSYTHLYAKSMFDGPLSCNIHFCNTSNEIATCSPYNERLLALCATKYIHFRRPGTPFSATYNEILAFLLSGGDFYYTYNEISTFSPSQSVFLLYV